MRSWIVCCVLGAVAGAAADAAAAPGEHGTSRAPLRVDVVYGPGTGRCPPRTVVHARLARELEALPRARGRVEITIEQGADQFVASVRVEERTRQVASFDCDELASSVAFVAAVALEEAEQGSPPRVVAEERVPSPDSVSARASTSEEGEGSSVGPRLGVRLHAGISARSGYVPGVWPVVSVGAALARTFSEDKGMRAFWSLGLEANLAPTETIIAPAGEDGVVTVSFTHVSGALVPCLGFAPHERVELAGCGLLTVGALMTSAEGDLDAQDHTQPVVLAGGRVATELRLVHGVALRGSVALEAQGVRSVVVVSTAEADEDVWRAPPVALAAGIDALYAF